MGRTLRHCLPGRPHHVILRGNNRRRLFAEESDFDLFTRLVAAARRPDDSVNVFCAMTNHVHLVCTPSNGPALSVFVKRFAQRFAQLYNRAHDSTGKLFEERFIAIPILSERQLAVTTAYIELNPVRAGIVTSPADYPWSTYAFHTNRPSRLPSALWTPTDWYRELGWDAAARAREYECWMSYCRYRGLAPDGDDAAASEYASQHPLPQRPDGSLAI